MTANPVSDISYIYPDLMRIDTPVLRNRFNTALDHLIGQGTQLDAFHIDLSGFSPEIAAELDDPYYMNPMGANRLFILISMEQANLPLVHQTFSCSETVLRDYMTLNYDALLNLTTKEAIYGELQNSVYRIKSLQQIADIKKIRVEVDTGSHVLPKSQRLVQLVNDLRDGDEVWKNDTLLQEIIDLTSVVGDVRKNEFILDQDTFSIDHFYTTHMGGVFVYGRDPRPCLIVSPDIKTAHAKNKDTADYELLSFEQIAEIVDLLDEKEHIKNRNDVDRYDFIANSKARRTALLISHAITSGTFDELEGFERSKMRRFTHKYLDNLPEVYHLLSDFISDLTSGKEIDQLRVSQQLIPYVLIPSDHGKSALTARLLSRLCPYDLLQTFDHDIEYFATLIIDWSEDQKGFFARYRKFVAAQQTYVLP